MPCLVELLFYTPSIVTVLPCALSEPATATQRRLFSKFGGIVALHRQTIE